MVRESILVSIVIPCWNVEKYIFRALESCLEQTYKGLEIIVVDDGSTDDTIKIIMGYQAKDSRIKLVKQNHKGVSAARNLGINEATGQKIIFLDSDDWLVQDAVEVLVKKALQYSGYLIGTKPLFITEGRENEGVKSADSKFETVVLEKQVALMNTDTDTYRNASVQYKLFDIDVIRRHGIYFDNEILFGEDGLFVFYYLNHVKGMVYLDVVLWNYLVRRQSSTRTTYNEKFITSIYGVEKMLAYNKENTEEINMMLESFLVTKALNMFRRYLDSGNKDNNIPVKYKDYIKKYKKSFLYRASLKQKVRTYAIIYIPTTIYITLYRCMHHINTDN